jgi:hypothetical protein
MKIIEQIFSKEKSVAQRDEECSEKHERKVPTRTQY